MTDLQQAISRRAAMKQILDGFEKLSVLNPSIDEEREIKRQIRLLHSDIQNYTEYIDEIKKAVD